MESGMGKRIDRERKTIDVMIGIYCRDHHGTKRGELCNECALLREYAFARLEKCRYQDAKPPCADCPIHCYKPDMREKVRRVMRYSGPRMLLRHPYLAIAHLRDGRKKVPDE
jgi:hypothetical protein